MSRENSVSEEPNTGGAESGERKVCSSARPILQRKHRATLPGATKRIAPRRLNNLRVLLQGQQRASLQKSQTKTSISLGRFTLIELTSCRRRTESTSESKNDNVLPFLSDEEEEDSDPPMTRKNLRKSATIGMFGSAAKTIQTDNRQRPSDCVGCR